MPQQLAALDLFSGICGIGAALHGMVQTIMYCDCDEYVRKVMDRLMQQGKVTPAPVWPDVRTLGRAQLKGKQVDIIFSSWPCVGFSNMGNRKHFEEAGSSLFYETLRLIDITRPKAVFFENVPQVLSEMPEIRQQLVVKRKFQLR